MNRRRFVASCAAGLAVASLPRFVRAQIPKRPELRITRIFVQPSAGRRLTPVAPNAYAAYRGFDRSQPVLRIQTAQGLEGLGHNSMPAEALRELLGLDPFQLFQWTADGRIAGRAEAHAARLARLGGTDIALLDLIGKALQRPIATLLGSAVRKSVPIYNSCLYMEDLLTPEQSTGLAYLEGPSPRDPVEMVARKATWILRRPEGFKAIKLKIGRSRWMHSPAEAEARDIAVTKVVRAAIGPDVKLFVDGNKDYDKRPQAAAEYAEAVRAANVSFLEQMLPDTDAKGLREFRLMLRAANNLVRLAGGESEVGGLPDDVYTQRVSVPGGTEPLLDIDQADMCRNGFLHIRDKAAAQRPLGMTFAPHNFGSKLGFYAQVHLGLIVPNWEASEIDDVNFPALHDDGFVVRDGVAKITGEPGLGVRLEPAALSAPTIDLKL